MGVNVNEMLLGKPQEPQPYSRMDVQKNITLTTETDQEPVH
jgi:hypothetical protein